MSFIYVILEAELDPLENDHRALSWRRVGFVKDEKKAIKICNKSKTLTSKDCWIISEPIKRLKYKKIPEYK